MSFQIGSKLPQPQLGWVRSEKARKLTRRCGLCGHTWATVELPIFKSWSGGAANTCPAHAEKGKLLDYASPQAVDRGRFHGDGPMFARGLGGYWRRYVCKQKNCVSVAGQKKKQKRQLPRARRARWSTVEVLASGVVCENVCRCSLCGGLGKVVRG